MDNITEKAQHISTCAVGFKGGSDLLIYNDLLMYSLKFKF